MQKRKDIDYYVNGTLKKPLIYLGKSEVSR